jgi:hypothetical protein
MQREKYGIAILDLGTGYTVATVPSAADNKNCVIMVTNGASGNPCLAFSDGTNWKQVNSVTTNITAT